MFPEGLKPIFEGEVAKYLDFITLPQRAEFCDSLQRMFLGSAWLKRWGLFIPHPPLLLG
jgi:hypothetical protein